MLVPRSTRPAATRRHRTPQVPPAPPPSPRGGSFCALCWGAGRILVHARNGEGLVPTPCRACDGGGTT